MQYQKYLCIDFKTFFSVTIIITLTFKTKNDILQEDYKGDYNSHKIVMSYAVMVSYLNIFTYMSFKSSFSM